MSAFVYFQTNEQEILRFSVGVGQSYGDYKRRSLSVVTHKNDKFYKLTYLSQARYAVDTPNRNVAIFGDHPLGKNLAELEVVGEPNLAMHSPFFSN